VPTAELIIGSCLVLAGISLIAIFRRERLARAAGEMSPIHPFWLGLSRGCALVIVLFAAYAVVMIILSALTGPPR
jgi:hypothetical protein